MKIHSSIASKATSVPVVSVWPVGCHQTAEKAFARSWGKPGGRR